MTFRNVLVIALMLFPLLRPRQVENAPSAWQNVGEGIEYQEFNLPDPNNVFVARMSRNNPNVTIDSSIGQGRLSGGAETVSSMAKRYDQAINYWGETLGNRNKVVVAINGYFFDTETGIPWRGQIQSGWYAKRFDNLENGSGFGWNLDRTPFIGECVTHRPEKQVITFLASENKKQTFNGINIPRGENDLILFTPQYDLTTLTDNTGVEVLVELSRPLMIIPSPKMVTGTVRTINDGAGSSIIPFDHIVLSATGSARTTLLENVQPGDVIGISQEITSFTENCKTIMPLIWDKTYASIGGSFYFLKDGVIQTFEDPGAIYRNPRTAVAYNDEYIFFIVVDGRDPFHSIGMSIVELASFAKNTLGATWGIAQDGGGSSTIVVNGEVRNNPNAELQAQQKKIYIPQILEAEPGMVKTLEMQNQAPARSSATTKIERAVANGLMMVVVEPKEQSNTLSAGDKVTATVQTNLRTGPGTNYPIIASISAGSQGAVLAHPKLNGVQAKGYYWWKVDFGGIVGWVEESTLIKL